MLRTIGEYLAAYLSQPAGYYRQFSVKTASVLEDALQPADVLLVEGNQRLSTAIKYLTQSTWSHAALYTGQNMPDSNDMMLVEADIQQGVVTVPLSKYSALNTRICRAASLSDEERSAVVQFMLERIGNQYDLKHIFDLARYLISTPPVPQPWRRRMIALGSGDPSRAICSTLIAQAFQSVRYPILPHNVGTSVVKGENGYSEREILNIRHHSLYVPRDFDLSPYFKIIKPTIEASFEHQNILWKDYE